MNKTIEETIFAANTFLKENITKNRLLILTEFEGMQDIDFQSISLKNLSFTKQETSKYSPSENEYTVFVCSFDYPGGSFNIHFDSYNYFPCLPEDGYDLNYAEHDGTSYEVYDEGNGFHEVLNYLDFSEFIVGNSSSYELQKDYAKVIAKTYHKRVIDNFPGVVDILPNDIERITLKFDNGIELSTGISNIEHSIFMFNRQKNNNNSEQE